jgi:hypothetical protein
LRDGGVYLSATQLAVLVDGLEWTRVFAEACKAAGARRVSEADFAGACSACMYRLVMANRREALPANPAVLTELVLALDAENEKLRVAVERLQPVYAVEAEVCGSSAEQRLAARRARTAPAMAALKARLTAMAGQFFSQSKLAEANHWDGLTLFLSDGRIEVDSNTVERSMRPIAMGRRNSLFSGRSWPRS